MDDIYLISMCGATITGVTVCDSSIAESMARQLRARKRKVKTFSDRESYLNFLEQEKQENG